MSTLTAYRGRPQQAHRAEQARDAENAEHRHLTGTAGCTGNLHTKILDFGRFDYSRILSLRGRIPRRTGNFTESRIWPHDISISYATKHSKSASEPRHTVIFGACITRIRHFAADISIIDVT